MSTFNSENNFGLVLIKTRDPLGRLYQLAQPLSPYSSIGFYIGNYVNIIDTIDCESPVWLTDQTMNELICNNHISELYLRRFRINIDHGIIRNWKIDPLDTTTALMNIFGEKCNNAIYYVNKLLILLFKIDQNEIIDECIRKTVIKNGSLEDKIIVNTNLTSEQRENLIKTYLIDFPHIDDKISITINPQKYNDKKIIKNLGYRLENFAIGLSHILARNHNHIFENLLARLNVENVIPDDLVKLLNNLGNEGYNLSALINDAVEKSYLKYEDYLLSSIKLNYFSKKALEYGNIDQMKISNISQISESKDQNLKNKIKILEKSKILIINVNDNNMTGGSFMETFDNIRNITLNLKNSVEYGNNIVLDLNALIRNVNRINEIIGSDSKIESMYGEYSVSGAIVVTDKNYIPSNIYSQLQEKNKLEDHYISTQGFNVDLFDSNELKAILNKLDSEPDSSEIFYSIRTAIVKKLGI